LNDNHIEELIDSNIKTLNSAYNLLNNLPADRFAHIQRPYFESSLGKHLRHILDHYSCFRRGYADGFIDYDQRLRETQVEVDKDYALSVLQQIIAFLSELKPLANANESLQVLMCNDENIPDGKVTQSSLGREMQFLQSHSVHHFALMAAMLRISGQFVDENFGVAPSTIVHEQTVKDTA
jgi:uncharacterized damage-inducible protein DinB